MIEDDARLADMVREYLAQSGFVVTRATDGNKGLAAVQAGVPDLVILDLMLPDMDDLALVKSIAIRHGALRKSPPIEAPVLSCDCLWRKKWMNVSKKQRFLK